MSDRRDSFAVRYSPPHGRPQKVVFEPRSSGGTLDGTDETIDAAIDDPLGFLYYLILDDSGSIVFDSDYVRETPDGTTSS